MTTQKQELRFDLEARCEVFVTADEIRHHRDYAKSIEIVHPDSRLYALKAIAVDCAQTRINLSNAERHIEVTEYPTSADVNIDRINWQELATESHV